MAYESEQGVIVDADAIDNELTVATSELETTIDDVDMAYDAAEELDEVEEALEAMRGETPPDYALKMVHDRLRHIHARTGLNIDSASLEDNTVASLESAVADKAKAVWKWIIKQISKASEFINNVFERVLGVSGRIMANAKQVAADAKAIPKDVKAPLPAKTPKRKNPRIVTLPSKTERKQQEWPEDTGSGEEVVETYYQHVDNVSKNSDVFAKGMAKLSYGGKSGGLDFISPTDSIPKTLLVANHAYQVIVDIEKELGKSPVDDIFNVGLLELTNRAALDGNVLRSLRQESVKRMSEKIDRFELDNLKTMTPFYAPDGSSLQYVDDGTGIVFVPSGVRSPNLDVVRKAVGGDWAKFFLDGRKVEAALNVCTKAVENADKNLRSANKQLPVAWKRLAEWAIKTGRQYNSQPHVIEYTKALVWLSQTLLKKIQNCVGLYKTTIACSAALFSMSREVTKVVARDA